MRKVLLFLTVYIFMLMNGPIYSQGTISDYAYKLFDKYSPTIEETNNLTVQYRRAIIGDLNNDDVADVIIEFGLGEEGSNGIVLKQAAIYLNNGKDLKVVAGFEPHYCMHIRKIENQMITIEELDACALPSPEIVKVRRYKLMNNKLLEAIQE